MFLIFNVDDMFDGMSAGIGMLIKLLIFIGIITPPLMFLEGGDWLAIVLPILVFSIIAGITNIIILIKSIKIIVKGKNITRKLKIKASFVIISIILLSALGFIFPNYLEIINIKVNNVISAIILPFLFNMLFYILLLGTNINVKYCYSTIKEYFIEIFLKKIFKFTFIILYIYSIVFLWSKGYFIKENYSDFLLSCATYYNNKYEENRNEGNTVIDIIEQQLGYIKNVVSKDQNEINKLVESRVLSLEDENFNVNFIKAYLFSDSMKELFNEKYGLDISIYSLSGTEYEDKIWILDVYDWMYGRTLYYKFDVEQCKVLEEFNSKVSVDRTIQNYKIELKNKQQ